MRKVALAVAVAAAMSLFAPATALAGRCGLPDGQPTWIEFGDPAAAFAHTVFRQPGLVIATSKPAYAASLRQAGAHTVYWDMHLVARVGTPSVPADPAVIVERANRLFDYAASTSGCATPLIALNELFGAHLPMPWTWSNAQYRMNVLAFLHALAERGARPFLLISRRPATAGATAGWWRDVAQVADIVREVYIPAPRIASKWPAGDDVYVRRVFRQAVRDFTRIGVSPSRVGLMLGFHTKPGTAGRDGLEPSYMWFEVVKTEALAARDVAVELGVPTIWSWGWGVWSDREADPDKAIAACVYLWARNPALCDGVAAAGPGFDASPIVPPPVVWPAAECAIGLRLAAAC